MSEQEPVTIDNISEKLEMLAIEIRAINSRLDVMENKIANAQHIVREEAAKHMTAFSKRIEAVQRKAGI